MYKSIMKKIIIHIYDSLYQYIYLVIQFKVPIVFSYRTFHYVIMQQLEKFIKVIVHIII